MGHTVSSDGRLDDINRWVEQKRERKKKKKINDMK